VLGDTVPVHPYARASWGPEQADSLLPAGETWYDPTAWISERLVCHAPAMRHVNSRSWCARSSTRYAIASRVYGYMLRAFWRALAAARAPLCLGQLGPSKPTACSPLAKPGTTRPP